MCCILTLNYIKEKGLLPNDFTGKKTSAFAYNEIMELKSSLSKRILSWYEENARPLPWRRDQDPYHVWISEIMLQQTRIETVIPYYERFLDTLPDIASLASVSDDELLKLWQGLGYYSRAKNLKKAAIAIMEKYQGTFPEDYEDIRSLPGIGPYTAGAIASICFDQKTPAIDGNVLRVFGRFLEEERNTADVSFKKDLYEALVRIYPEKAGDFTSALMEIGEILCLPNTLPLCEECPLKKDCLSYKHRSTLEYPKMPEKKKARREERSIFLLLHKNTAAIGKRGDSGLLSGLYEFPNEEGRFSEEEILNRFKGLQPVSSRKAGSYVHQFSHIHWDNEVWIIRCGKEDLYEWMSLKDIEEKAALPSAFAKCMEYLKEEL